jgi:hypothetical protein
MVALKLSRGFFSGEVMEFEMYLHESALDTAVLVICLARFAFVQFWIDSIFA